VRVRGVAAGLASTVVTVGVPLILVLGLVRVAMSPQFLEFEYRRPDMHQDPFGFTLEDRLRYGPLGIEYLLTGADISLLEDLRFRDGRSMFSERELDHMRDVKRVTRSAFFVLAALIAAVPAAGAYLLWAGRRADLWHALFRGAVATLALILAVIVGAVMAWDFFFGLFHRVFFADGTWVFMTSDTLIRLYPEKFWFDAALLIGFGVVGSATAILVVSAWAMRRAVMPDGTGSR
jgi:integral membrane protein (TIGR01906 family)